MKKKSITFKLFIITSLFFIIFTSTTMLLRTLFIENFYLDQKTKDFAANFRSFSASYANLMKNNGDHSALLARFQSENNASTAVVNLSATLNFLSEKLNFSLRN